MQIRPFYDISADLFHRDKDESTAKNGPLAPAASVFDPNVKINLPGMDYGTHFEKPALNNYKVFPICKRHLDN